MFAPAPRNRCSTHQPTKQHFSLHVCGRRAKKRKYTQKQWRKEYSEKRTQRGCLVVAVRAVSSREYPPCENTSGTQRRERCNGQPRCKPKEYLAATKE